ncbi:MAG: sensor histidine kinase [Bacillota bacterium]
MKHLSFRIKVISIFLIAAVTLGAIIGLISYSHSKRIVVENKKKEMADTVNRIDININLRVRYIMDAAENGAGSHVVQDLFPRNGNGGTPDNKAYLDEYLQNVLRSFNAVNNIFVLDDKGILYARYALQGQVPSAERLAGYVDLAAQNPQKSIWTGVTESLPRADQTETEPVLYVIRAIAGPEGKPVRGALVIELEQDTFSNLIFDNNGIWERQYSVIVDKQAEVICSNIKMDTSWLNAIEQRFEKGERGFTLNWMGRPYYVRGQYNGVTGWRTYSLIAEKDIFRESGELKQEILLSVAIITLCISTAIAFVAYAITQPINRLSEAMRSAQEHNFDIRLPNRRKDEIGKLTDSFNYMIGRINTLVNTVYQEKLAQKNAEIKALQAQINPHFLYNTLDSINWMLLDRGAKDISDIVLSLGSLMRYCTDTKTPLVRLEEEFEYAACYLRIQKNRLEERLRYEMELPDPIRNVQVPKFILQPLVENAILHGIEPCKRQGLIRIVAEDAGAMVAITIEDNGVGIPDEILAALNACLDTQHRQGGIGLFNVDKRLRLYYGEEHRLKVYNTRQGARIMLTIPKAHPEEDP